MSFVQRSSRTLVLVTLGVLAALGAASAATSGATVQSVTDAALGTKIIVSSRGFTLYHLTSEKKGTIACTGTCRKTWPPLLVTGSAKPGAGAGVTAAKLGTIKRPDGGVQVTYDGYALYLYSGDKRSGQVGGQGSGGVWYAITPGGAVTKAKVKATGAPPTTTTAGGAPAPTTTTAPAGVTGPITDNADGCPAGQGIPQGAAAGDGDNDNIGGETDGDGCL
jgi:predicted lipoprotein with Yx(FWY)xxD motif